MGLSPSWLPTIPDHGRAEGALSNSLLLYDLWPSLLPVVGICLERQSNGRRTGSSLRDLPNEGTDHWCKVRGPEITALTLFPHLSWSWILETESACPRSGATTMVCHFIDGVSQYLCFPRAPFQEVQFVSGTVERPSPDKLIANWAPSSPSLGATREKRFRPWLYS